MEKLGHIAFVFVVYVALCHFSLVVQRATGMGTQIWPAAGFALTVILVWGRHVWPGIFFGTLAIHATTGDAMTFLGSAIGNTIEPLLGAYLCSKSFSRSLDNFGDIIRFLLGAVVASTFVGTAVAIPTIWAWGDANIDINYFAQYWLGDAMGVLLIAPLLLVWTSSRRVGGFALQDVKIMEAAAFMLATIGVMTGFAMLDGPARLYFFFPLILWVTLRLGQRGLTVTNFALASMLIWHTANGLGPFADLTPHIVRETYQSMFLATLQTTGLIVASCVLQREFERTAKEDIMTRSHKELEEMIVQLKAAKNAAEIANAAKSDFLAIISHEIRTPLGVLLGFSEELASEPLSQTDKKKYVEMMKKSGAQLTKTIDSILDFVTMEREESSANMSEVNLQDLLTSVKFLLDTEANKKGLSLKLQANREVPALVLTDPIRLRRILINLVGNAIKFTPCGYIDVRCKLVSQEGEYCKLAFVISDTGIGIAPEMVKTLFSPFSQADTSATRRFGGVGLGLALSKRLAKTLGGDVELSESSPGKGSIFTITIKAGLVAPEKGKPDDDTGIPKFPAQDKAHGLAHKKVLVVDDCQENLILVRCILRSTQAEVQVASNGKEAIGKAADDDFDVVLMDLQMPEIDGYEATEILRSKGFNKPIIALTAHVKEEVEARCLANGFDAYLSKPVKKENLIEVMTETMAHSSASRRARNAQLCS
jgi:signal transduction histidine kinase/ActR/RegA family two-component response regulator